MKVILTIDNTQESENSSSTCYKYDLPEEYIEKDEFEQITLPRGDNFRFYSAGYIYRICEKEWLEFDDPPNKVIENILSKIKK